MFLKFLISTTAVSIAALFTLSSNAAELVSTNEIGNDTGNGESRLPAFSADGRFVVFESSAGDLGSVDTNGISDIYVRDLVHRTTTLISVNSAGTDSGNNRSGSTAGHAISADGRFVAFASLASDLGPTDTNGLYDIYVRDLANGTTTLVSINNAGTDGGNGHSTNPFISADGRFVAFHSDASDLGPADTNGYRDVYVRDLVNGTTALVSVNSTGTDSGAWGGAFIAGMTPDGHFVLFTSLASNIGPGTNNFASDVYVRDLIADSTTLVSVDGAGTDGGNGHSGASAITPDGRFVVFRSYANNLGPTDTNGDFYNWASDVYVRDLVDGTTTLVSVNSSGTDSGNAGSDYGVPSISADGRFVAFHSDASDLGPADTNGYRDVYVRDLVNGTTTLVSVNSTGTDTANNISARPIISDDGRFVAFESRADDLGPTDTNGAIDIYVRDLVNSTTTLVSVNSGGTDAGNDDSRVRPQLDHLRVISADAKFVVFESNASDLVQTDTNGASDAYLAAIGQATESLANLERLVTAVNTKNGIKDSLDAKFDAVQRALASVNTNDDVAALEILEAFIDSVEAQRGISLSDAEADALIIAATQALFLISQ